MLGDIGLLVHWVSLLSTYGDEQYMLEDLSVVAERLSEVTILLHAPSEEAPAA